MNLVNPDSDNNRIAGETRSDARMASEGPRATVRKMIFLAKRFLILEILEILEILLQTIKIAGETLSDARMEPPRAPALRHKRRFLMH